MDSRFFTTVLSTAPGDGDIAGLLRPGAFQGLLISAATRHLALLGASRADTLRLLGAVWVLARARFELLRPVLCGDDVTVKTWSADAQGAGFQRECEMFAGGECVARSVTLWCLADLKTRRLLRPSAISGLIDLNTAGGARFAPPTRLRLPERGEPYLHTVRYSDADMNGHLHNARYVDICCDALSLERNYRRVREFQINYCLECLPGDTISIYSQTDGDEALLCGIGADGKIRFEARLILEDFHY